MAVAFSNSLVGILSAVVLTILGVVSNVTDRRTALMVQIETYLDRCCRQRTRGGRRAHPVAGFADSVARLEGDRGTVRVSAPDASRHARRIFREVQLVVALKPGDGELGRKSRAKPTTPSVGHDGTREIWPSFTDVMSTMALILFVLVLLAYVQQPHQQQAHRRVPASDRHFASSSCDAERGDPRSAGRSSRPRRPSSANSKTSSPTAIASSTPCRSQLQSIAVLRVSVLNKLKQAIEAQLGSEHPTGPSS